ncbi:MAG: glycoside hydrolase family 127 protein, partial [Ignavibacteria bacterium]|nr:glycoside hydrolase family 127 protein [Ignavibacteria bacterium]
MKISVKSKFIGTLALAVNIHCASDSPKDYPVTPVRYTEVHLTDEFWSPRIETNRKVTIPAVFKKSEETGRIDNFAIAGGLKEGEQSGIYPFDDTDPYKTLEGAAYSLGLHPDPELDKYLDSLIVNIGRAQEEDGYLYTCRTNKAAKLINWSGESRWSKLERSHELYNAGHLYEAAVAHYQATGKRTLLDIALKNADLVTSVFGPDKTRSPPGHQVIEMGLAKLYRETGQKEYLDMAKFFLDERGHSHNGRELWGQYAQDHKPILEQDEAVGHAVRAPYMYSGMADVAALSGDFSYVDAIDRIWENVVGKKLYITGGIGSQGMGETLGANYDLPNMSAYNETCASIANVMWNHRLFLLHGDAKYLDVMERTLYNGLIAGVSLTGDRFFYPNPLASRGQHERSPWFACACCPTNMTRFVPTIPGYVYAHSDNMLYVNLFVESSATVTIDGNIVHIKQETRYPWDGDVKMMVDPGDSREFAVYIRIPGWARNKPVPSDLYRYMNKSDEEVTLKLNSERIVLSLEKGFARIHRKWDKGDTIELSLPMPIRRARANDKAEENVGKVAIQRGPIVYCAEWPDNKDGHVLNLVLPDNVVLRAENRQDLLNGVEVITGKALGVKYSGDSLLKEEQDFVAIPYYAWAHRGRGEMTVWIANDPSKAKPLFGPSIATISRASSSEGVGVNALNDEKDPKNSGDKSHGYFLWSPRMDTVWVQYDFKQTEEVSEVQVYWADDTSFGDCRVPESWQILAHFNGEWRKVWTPQKEWGVEKDR